VVGYTTLREITNGKVAVHATLGSPLWIRTVRRMLGPDGRRYTCDYWVNVDARGDIIGGKLHDAYYVNHDYKVPSVGGSPHSSYFHPDNALVQCDIVARVIKEISSRI